MTLLHGMIMDKCEMRKGVEVKEYDEDFMRRPLYMNT